MHETVLALDDVAMTFPDGSGRRRVIDGAGLEVQSGRMVAITGPSGCGKTTLLRIATGLLRPDRGSVVVAGSPLDPARPADVARTRLERIGLIDQEYGLLDAESVLDNVALPLRFGTPRLGRHARREAAGRALQRAGLEVDLRRRVDRLSGGERQRVAIARALVREPQLLVADEPTASLDAETGARIIELLGALAARGSGVLVATHDPQVSAACDLTLHFVGPRLERVQVPAW